MATLLVHVDCRSLRDCLFPHRHLVGGGDPSAPHQSLCFPATADRPEITWVNDLDGGLGLEGIGEQTIRLCKGCGRGD